MVYKKSVSIKNSLYIQYIKLKDLVPKNEAQIDYKQYINLSTFLEDSKKFYFTNYFQNNLNNLKSTWKDIKKSFSLKESSNIAASIFIENDCTVTKTREITNHFNKYFVHIAGDIQFSIRYSKNNFHDFLPPLDKDSFFYQPKILSR